MDSDHAKREGRAEYMERVALQHEDGGFLCQDAANRWLKIKDPQQALHLSRKKAENVLKSNIRPEEQGQWRIVPESAWGDNRPVPMLGDVDWGQLLLQIGEMYQDIEGYSRCLQRLHSEADLEICDLLHYIEFSLLNAAKGYQAYRMLRDALVRRRQIKDEICRSNMFLNGTAKDFKSGKIQEQMSALDCRKYGPRIREELFK